jgi:type II secretory pathway component PulJ
MIELLISVSLMVIILGVLAFVFRQSSEAVSSSTEAVNVIQKARTLEARLGKEVAGAVSYAVQDSGGAVQRAWRLSGDGKKVEFASQTLSNGILDTWYVQYALEGDALRRRTATHDPAIWTQATEPSPFHTDEVLVRPVKDDFKFEAVGDPGDTRLPASLKLTVTFLDSRGGRSFLFPMQFYFPIYQGQ